MNWKNRIAALLLCAVTAVCGSTYRSLAAEDPRGAGTESAPLTVAPAEDGEQPEAAAKETLPFEVDCRSVVLMDANTGTVLYESAGAEALPPASVTKVMTLLLIMEAVDGGVMQLTDLLTVSEYAASMGGSQVFLECGEQMTVEDFLKSVIVASANDAAVVLAEAVAGSEEAFVARMNERAGELGMTTASFENVTGLDDDTTNHVMSAMDIALCSRELLKHPTILQYSGIWMDSIRDGAFGLTNTNRLIRFYSGATGLKTGSTSKAKFCISATAKRDNLHLIAVIMGAPSRDARNEIAKKLLDWGFANYSIYENEGGEAEALPVTGGVENSCPCRFGGISVLLPRGKSASVTTEFDMKESLAAPVTAGDVVGEVRYLLDGEVLGTCPVTADRNIPKISFFGNLGRMFAHFLLR